VSNGQWLCSGTTDVELLFNFKSEMSSRSLGHASLCHRLDKSALRCLNSAHGMSERKQEYNTTFYLKPAAICTRFIVGMHNIQAPTQRDKQSF
jgi:hypothetical protein